MARKAEKKRIREEKQAAAQRRRRINSWLLKAAIAVLVPLTAFVLFQGLSTRAPRLAPDEISASDHLRGAEDAPLIITVYADFQCPSCALEMDLIDRAWPRISQDARVVFRHFPVDSNRFSFLAATYAEAAARQGKFWEMHDLLFVNQQAWSAQEDLEGAAATFDDYAAQAELDLEQLKADLELGAVRAKIIADQQGGIRAGVRGTPSMYFNGRPVRNPRSVGELMQMVNDAVAEMAAE